jgi:hypothetical protein
MRCEEARQLFDAYLNGELSTRMATELHAHRVKCGSCRRELALLEVSGHVLRVDREAVGLDADFTDRLMACMETPKSRWPRRLRWAAYVGAPLAAAAVVAMAFLGVFDASGRGQVAGVSIPVEDVLGEPPVPAVLGDPPPAADEVKPAQSSFDEWFRRMQSDVEARRREGQTPDRAVDLTILQLMDILEEAKKDPQEQNHFPVGDDSTGEPSEKQPQRSFDNAPDR